MTIAHKDIPNSELHEPKNISTAVSNSVYVANGFATGAWTRPTEKLTDRSDKTKNVFVWNSIADNLYTSGSPLAIAATTRTKLTNNGLLAGTDTSRLGSIWNTTTNVLLIDDLNAIYDVRVSMHVKAAAAAGTPYTLKFEMESATGPTVFLARDSYINGGSYENAVNMSYSFPLTSAVNNTNISFYLTPDTAITVHQIEFLIQRTYAEKNY